MIRLPRKGRKRLRRQVRCLWCISEMTGTVFGLHSVVEVECCESHRRQLGLQNLNGYFGVTP